MAKPKLKTQDQLVIFNSQTVIEPAVETVERKPKLSFEQWWATKGLNVTEAVKDMIKVHMTVKGYIERREFDLGLKDFGL